MLGNIAPEVVDYAKQMLDILCSAVRPLEDIELLDALAVNPGTTYNYDATRKFDDICAFEEICPGFTKINKNEETGTTTIQIAHLSIPEFLQGTSILGYQDIAIFRVRKLDAHTYMARACLALLLEPRVMRVTPDEGSGLPLATEYAAMYWFEHYEQCGSRELVESQAWPLFKNIHLFGNWLRTWDIDRNSSGLNHQRRTPLYYASLLGLTLTATKLLYFDNQVPGAVTDTAEMFGSTSMFSAEKFGTPLQAASYKGHGDIVELLLDRGADVNIQGGYYGTALQAASHQGHKRIVKLLLNKGANVNLLSTSYGTALQLASYKGHEDTVRLLIEAGANVNFRGGSYGTSLQAALFDGHQEIVKMLLVEGADPNIESGYFGTALQAAACIGCKGSVKLLLGRGAQVNAQTGYHKTALQAALFGGHHEVVELLQMSGARKSI